MNSKYSVELQKQMLESIVSGENRFEDGKNERFLRRGTRTTYQKQVVLRKNVSKKIKENERKVCAN